MLNLRKLATLCERAMEVHRNFFVLGVPMTDLYILQYFFSQIAVIWRSLLSSELLSHNMHCHRNKLEFNRPNNHVDHL